MTGRRIPVLAAVLAVATGGIAAAQSTIYGPGAEDIVEQRVVPATVTGELTIEFQGPDGARGTIVAEPVRRSQLEWYRMRTGSGPRLGAFLGPVSYGEPQVRAIVERGTAPAVSRCADAVSADGVIDVTGGRRLAVRLLPRSPIAGAQLRTRCGGPLVRDLGRLPEAELGLAALRSGHRTLDLRAERPFAGAGFTGSIRSTVQMTLGAVRGGRDGGGGGVPDTTRRQRVVTARYRVAAVTGTVGVALRGAGRPSAVCRALDSCGATGQLTIRPSFRRAVATFFASAPPTTSPAALRAVFGAGPGSPPAGQGVDGYAAMLGRAAVPTSVRRPDGSVCAAAGQAGGSEFTLAVRRGRLLAGYAPLGLESRCAGPLLRGGLAMGSVPASVLRHRTVRIPLDRGRTLADDGWRATSRPDLVLHLRRTAVRVRLVRAP